MKVGVPSLRAELPALDELRAVVTSAHVLRSFALPSRVG
jgi:hypothetical protein